MGAAAINSSKAAFIVRILVESLQHRQDPRVLQIRRLLEAGFTGMRTDKRGVKRYYRDGRQIANPTAAEKKAVTNRGQRAVAKHLRISHDEAKSRISAIGPDTPPEHIKALANDLMNLSYKDLIRIKQDLGARGGWGSKAKMTDRLQQGVTRNELPTATRSGLQAVRVQRSADGKGLEIDPTGQSNRIAWQTPDGKLHSTAIGAYGHLKQNKHLVEPKAAEPEAPKADSQQPPTSNHTPLFDGDTTPRLSDDDVVGNKGWDTFYSGLGTEVVMSRMAQGMKGINGLEYAIYKRPSGKYQLVSRPATKANKPDQPQQSAAAKPELTRAKPRSLVTFGKPITGPSGAKIESYQWQHKTIDDEDKRDGEAAKRVSDWTKAINSVDTGKEIVHHFSVAMPDGSKKIVSLESAIKLLGYQPGDASAAKVRSTAASMRTLAMAQMQLAMTRQAAADNEAIKAKVAQMQPPEMEVQKGMFLGEPNPKHNTYIMGKARIMRPVSQLADVGSKDPEEDIRQDLTDTWRKNQVIALGGDPYDIHKTQAENLQEKVKKLEKTLNASASTGYNQPEQGFTGIDAEGREWRNGELVAKQPEDPAKDEPAQPQEPAGETPGSATEPAPTPAAPEAPAEKPKAKRKRKSRAKMTILGIVAKQGGINPQSVKAMANYKEQIVEGGLLHAIRKNGIDIGKMAESLERQGHFRTPPDRHADDYLLELMAKRSYSQLAEEHYNLDKEQEEYYKALEDAQGEHDEREVAAARGRGEEAGREEGENSSVSEVSGWDQPDEEGTGGAEEEDYDRNEPAGQELDTSFDFGANAEEPQEPETKSNSEPTPGFTGFTGIDAQGREWRNGELVAKQEEPAGAKPATDLFGNPLPANQPKEPETMPGLFGERVPVAPDKPQAAPSQPEPMPGTDNPLDRPDAAKKDDTQDMFGLFGPGSRQAAREESPEDAPTSPAAVADQDQPGDTPRTKAARVSAALDADYENARASAVPNMGADIKGSARHKAMAWKGLKDAEANGTAEAMVRRDELLKHEPSNLSTILNKTNFLGVLTSQLIMQAFPKEVHGYGKYIRSSQYHISTPEQLRAQYYEAFTDIKKLTEDLAAKGADPKEITAELKIKVSNLIDKFRKKGEGKEILAVLQSGTIQRSNGDSYNPIANSLADMYNRLSKRGSTSVLGRVSDFGQRLMVATKNQDPSMETVNKAVSAVADILEGKSFNQAFDTVEKKKAGFDYNEAYGGEVVRKGGKSINMNEQSLSRPGSKVFMDDMQMRGVQFGNSLPDAERIYHSQKSAEALSDLTEILGFPSYAASLGGSLGLAIGARGRGGARAHFEPWQADDKSNPNVGGPVINLTRANGAGSLAHEWGHGLDYFAANNSPGETKFLSQGRGSPKTIEAMKKVQEAMASSGFMDRMHDATVALDPVERSYWNSSKEKFARTFERYVQNKLHDADRENTYLTGLHKATHPYWPNNQEMDHIEPFMDALMTAIAAEKFPDHTMPEITSKEKKQRPKEPEKPKQSTKPTFIRFGTKPPPGGWKDSDRVPSPEFAAKYGWTGTGVDENGNQWINGKFAGEEGTYKEAVMPTDHAAKIKLIQSIIAQTGATPPKPRQAQEAEQDPRVQRIRELLGQRC